LYTRKAVIQLKKAYMPTTKDRVRHEYDKGTVTKFNLT